MKMKKNGVTKIVSLYVLTFFMGLASNACSSMDFDDEGMIEFVELNLDKYQVIPNYISFEQNEVKEDPIYLGKEAPSSKQLIICDNDVFLQDFRYVTEFEVVSEDSLCMYVGRTDGFIRFKDTYFSVCKYHTDIEGLVVNDQIELTAPLIKGYRYEIGYHKTLYGVSFFLRGMGINIERWYDIKDDPMQNRLIGNPFFAVNNGTVKVYKSYLSSGYKNHIKVLVSGDSFIEGTASTQYGYPINSRWCAKLAEDIGVENCAIDGIGGDAVSEQWFNRLARDCSWFSPEYVIISMGTNNYWRESEYMTYMGKAIHMLKNEGIHPILVTVTPRYDQPDSPVPERINKWVRESGELYVDMNAAVTLSDDPTRWKNGFILPDGIHPSVEGYNAMYERIKLDCPFLFAD